MDTPRLSVVIPVRDEADNIEMLAREIEAALDGLAWECVWVDDHSADATPVVLRALRARDPRHRLLEFAEPRGQTAALLAGFRAARGDFVAGMDGDGQNDPADLIPLLRHAEANGLDMVNGIRAVRHDSTVRLWSSRIANGFRNAITGDRITDVGCAIRVIRRPFAAAIPAYRGIHRFLPTMVRLQGGLIGEIQVRHRPRTAGRTKYGINNRLWSGLADTFAVRWMTRRVVNVTAREIGDPAAPPVRPEPAAPPRIAVPPPAAAPSAAAWLGFAVLLAVLAFGFQGTRGLWEPDEGRYAEVAREMLVTGDFLVPRLNFQPHFTKPPLTYWSIAASIAAFGRSEWAVRLYLSIAYLATTLIVTALGSRMWNRRAGYAAGVVYATSLLPFVGASTATPDTLLALWETAALYALWRGWTAETERERFAWPAAAGAAFGLAFLTKGPPGLLFLPAAWLFRGLVRRHGRRPAPAVSRAGWIAFAALGLGWFAMILVRDPALFSYFVGHEVVGRVSGEHHRNAEWYGALAIYGPAFLIGFLPWNLFAGRVLRRAFPEGPGRAGLAALRDRPRALFLATAFLVPLVVFAFARSRLVLYVLPLFAPLALATGAALAEPGVFGRRFSPRRLAGIPALACALLALRLGVALWPNEHDARRLFRMLPKGNGFEIVALDTRPHYGLLFYSGWRLDPVAWDASDPARKPVLEELREEHRPEGEAHLFLMRSRDADRFSAMVTGEGLPCVVPHDLGNLVAFVEDCP